MSASETQVGGTHYKDMGEFQPWDVLQHWLTPEEYRGYQKGVVIAYLARERVKGGDQDIRKAAHHLNKLVEVLDAADAQHAATAPVVIQPAPDYLPDSVAVRFHEQCPDPHGAANNTATLAALDVVAANADPDDGWIEWGGGVCPVPALTSIQFKLRGYETIGGPCNAGSLSWFHDSIRPHSDIIAYRVIKTN